MVHSHRQIWYTYLADPVVKDSRRLSGPVSVPRQAVLHDGAALVSKDEDALKSNGEDSDRGVKKRKTEKSLISGFVFVTDLGISLIIASPE